MSSPSKYTSKLQGKAVLVIGGSSGIGMAVAEAALEHGAIVSIAGSNQAKVDRAVSYLQTGNKSKSAQVFGFQCDLANPETIDSNIQTLLEVAASKAHNGKLNHIVLTAATLYLPPSLAEVTVENIQSPGVIRYVAPLLIAKHLPSYMELSVCNSFTLTSGSIAHKPDPGWSLICGYVGAVEALGRGLALDLKPLRVNVVSPGAVLTDTVREVLGDDLERILDVTREKSTTGEFGTPENVAQAFLYLMKDCYASGSVVETNGGMHLV